MAEHPPHIYADSVELAPTSCRTCGRRIVWGLTVKGRRAPFDYPRSSDGYVNHWVTCPSPPERAKTKG